MAKDRKKLQHIHSSVPDKQPTPSTLEVGEIAVNNSKDQEFLSIKNSEDKVVRFSSEEQIASYTGACGTITSITSNQTWITDLSWSNNASGSITADIAANCGASREATITVNYTVNGSSCTNRTFKVKQCAGGYTGLSLNGTPDCNGGVFTYTPTPRT